ncbi:hypothetical protein [Pseudohalioglobus lutimaris]|uniref:Uncharacterized protein n=1 Tax=Pseudohalioglobus lutimaris TaxID=1737061 RepID=A0A2N5X1I5_9GAMM|nr:hypothetical protein [Pseudohalioglobus lutimaris]PLW68347.1 hypothetical protein C0039_12440 [Pseudohalioglobus lutimaris]
MACELQSRTCLWLLLLVVSPIWAEVPESRYERTVVALQTAEPTVRKRFARIALFELAGIYLAEADLARAEAEASAKSRRLIAWSQAVSRYADGLFLLLEEIEQGATVSLRLNDKEVPSIAVDNRTIMLAHPRRDQQAAYEQGVLAEFCTHSICRELIAQDEQKPIPVSQNTVAPDWVFSKAGLRCDYRGLQISFRPGGQMAAQKALCTQLMEEAEMLATEIAWQQRHSVAINWDGMLIKSTPGKTAHLVTINDAGDSLLLSLPLMHSAPDLLRQVTPWLQNRFLPDGQVTLELDAADLGWE